MNQAITNNVISDRVFCRITVSALALLLSVSLTHCDSLDEAGLADQFILRVPPPPGLLRLRNQTQFSIRHFLVYGNETVYREADNLLEDVLPAGEDFTVCVKPEEAMVTVSRLKNQDGPLLAFTTGQPLEFLPGSSRDLEILENEFREQILEPGFAADRWEERYYELEYNYQEELSLNPDPTEEATADTGTGEEDTTGGATPEEETPDNGETGTGPPWPDQTEWKTRLPGCQPYGGYESQVLADLPCACPWSPTNSTL